MTKEENLKRKTEAEFWETWAVSAIKGRIARLGDTEFGGKEE